MYTKVADEQDTSDAAAAAPQNSHVSDTDKVDESIYKRARDKSFDSLKQILSEALSKHLMLRRLVP